MAVRALVTFCVVGIHLIVLLQLELGEINTEIIGLEALENLRETYGVKMAVEMRKRR